MEYACEQSSSRQQQQSLSQIIEKVLGGLKPKGEEEETMIIEVAEVLEDQGPEV